MDKKDKEIAELREENRILKGLVASLTARIAELEARLNKNSKNSSKPPSSDGPKKGAPKNNREPNGRRSGGQAGHEGVTKELTPEPDTVVELNPKTECECGEKIIIQEGGFVVRQVTDIQLPRVITVEYRSKEGICAGCGKIHKAGFPDEVKGTVSYGDNLQAIVTYLTTYQLIPLARAVELVKDLFGVKISQGLIVNSSQEAYEKLADTESRITKELINSEVVHFDESGMRVSGKTHWMHSAGTDKATMYLIHEKRGKAAMDEMGILPFFQGTAIHDHWKSYYHYTAASHGECNEHHLRTLKYIHEDMGEAWAGEMVCLLLRIKAHVDLSKLFGADRLEQDDIDTYERIYREILERAVAGTEASKESKRMSKRLVAYEQETLLFMLDFNVPFTNNLAERDIRMPKAKQKISGCFRSDAGAKAFARIRGFVSTVKKKGKNAYDGLVSVFKGDASTFLYPNTLDD